MSQFSVYLIAPDYLSQWLRNEFWDEEKRRVVFPRQSVERTILDLFIKKRPADLPPNIASDDDALPIEVPTFAGKNPATYNYLPPYGASALLKTIKRRFKRMLWDELHVIHAEDVQITDIIYAFMEKHGIEPTEKNWETIRQMYARMRKVYKK